MAAPTSELLKWRAELLGERDQIGRDLEPLLRRRDELNRQLETLDRLLEDLAPKGAAGPAATHDARSIVVPAASSTTIRLQKAVEDVLRASGAPMHIREIRSALSQRGVTIPGKGTDANVIVHLRRASDVFRPHGRGTYALVEWDRDKRVG